MDHLTEEQLLELAEDLEPKIDHAAHLAVCRQCRAELDVLGVLFKEIKKLPEPALDDIRFENMVQAIDARIESDGSPRTAYNQRTRNVPKWIGAIVLPMAAAALLFILPRVYQLTTGPRTEVVVGDTEEDLTPSQWEMVWQGLTDGMDELATLNSFLPQTEKPYEELQDLTDDELERLLELLDDSRLG